MGFPANALVAADFRRLADLLEIEGANPFRVGAYRRAAATVESLSQDVAKMDLQMLDALPGVGADLAGKIAEICQTAHLSLLDATEARTPSTLVELSRLPGLGPKRIQQLHTELGVRSISDLRVVIANGALRKLPGFGRVVEDRLCAALAMTPFQRWPRADAEPQARTLAAALRRLPGVEATSVAGSIRRGRPDVGDIDLVAAARPGAEVTRAFIALPQVAEVLACGSARATVRLTSGLQADLLVAAPESYGAALVHFTGSKAHNIALRQRAQALGLKLNEYGLHRGRTRIAGRTEAEIYAGLGLKMFPPTQREGRAGIAGTPD